MSVDEEAKKFEKVVKALVKWVQIAQLDLVDLKERVKKLEEAKKT